MLVRRFVKTNSCVNIVRLHSPWRNPYLFPRNIIKTIPVWYEPPTSFVDDLLFAVGSPVSFVALAVISVDTIYTLAIDTRTWTALVNIDVTVRTWESGLAFTVIKSLARLAVKEVRAVSGAHVQSCKKKVPRKLVTKQQLRKEKKKLCKCCSAIGQNNA